jgi:Flp pilus assembly protein TadD
VNANRKLIPIVAAAVWLALPLASATAADAAQFRFERQLRVNPFDPAALNNLAVVKAGQGRYGDAKELLERAARLAPDSTEIEANLTRLRIWMDEAGEPRAPTGPGLDASPFPPEPPRLWDTVPPR